MTTTLWNECNFTYQVFIKAVTHYWSTLMTIYLIWFSDISASLVLVISAPCWSRRHIVEEQPRQSREARAREVAAVQTTAVFELNWLTQKEKDEKGARGESRRTGSVNIRLMVCSLKWQRSARPSGLQPWNCGRFFRDKNIDFPAMEWLLSLPTTHTHKHTLHSYFTSVHCLIFCLFVLRAQISPMTAWHRCRVLKPARNKSIDWFPEGNLVSTLSRTEALLLLSLPKLIGCRSHQTSHSLPHRRRTVLSSSAATRS